MSVKNMKKTSRTDWARVDALTDAEIDISDIPPLSDHFFSRAVLRTPKKPVRISLRVDPDVLAWFKAQGSDCEQRLNAALRIYALAHKP